MLKSWHLIPLDPGSRGLRLNSSCCVLAAPRTWWQNSIRVQQPLTTAPLQGWDFDSVSGWKCKPLGKDWSELCGSLRCSPRTSRQKSSSPEIKQRGAVSLNSSTWPGWRTETQLPELQWRWIMSLRCMCFKENIISLIFCRKDEFN